MHTCKPDVVASVLVESSKQTDMNLRELWANLLAQELLGGTVHPEVVNILKRLTSEDAQTLAKIAEENPDGDYITSFKSSVFGVKSGSEAEMSIGLLGLKATMRKRPKFSFSEKLLESLNLIEREGGSWVLSPIGEGFIASVSEPVEEDFA